MLKSQNLVTILLIILIIFAALAQIVRVIPAGRTGVVFNLNGGIQKNHYEEGIHFMIPFLQTLIVFDTRILTYSFSDPGQDYDGFRFGSPVVVKTKDGQEVKVEISFVTQMIKDRSPEVYQKFRTDYTPVLKSKSSRSVQEVVSTHEAVDLYSYDKRRLVVKEIFEGLATSFLDSGFELKDIFLRDVEFKEDYITEIERKQIALQKAQLAEVRKAIAIKEKEIAIIKGEAQAKVLDIKGRAIQRNPKVAELEYLEEIERSGRNVPVINGLRGNTFINLDKIVPQS